MSQPPPLMLNHLLPAPTDCHRRPFAIAVSGVRWWQSNSENGLNSHSDHLRAAKCGFPGTEHRFQAIGARRRPFHGTDSRSPPDILMKPKAAQQAAFG